MLERVSRAKVLTCSYKNNCFTENVYINEAIKKCKWRQLIVDSMAAGKLKVQMKNNWFLDSFVA